VACGLLYEVMVPTTVFVTDGDQRSALAITRALGHRGLSVIVGSDRPVSIASSSRFCSRRVMYPSPVADRAAFDRFLIDFVERERVDVLIPVTDVTMHAVCSNHDRLERHCAMAVPTLESFELVSDKWRVLQTAARCGIAVPRTHIISGLAGLNAHLDMIEYPAVVKPGRSRIRTAHGWMATSVHYASSADDLRRLYRDVSYVSGYPSLIQPRIVGPGVGVFVLCDHGRQVVCFAHRRLREKPPAGGPSVLCESIAISPALRTQAERLLAPLGWHGVAMLEFKQDSASGDLFLMEVNGRFWGSLQLAIDAGIDFPFLTCQLALGRQPHPPASYAIGVKSRWLLGDFDHLLLRLFKSGRDLELPPAAPSRARVVADFIRIGDANVRSDVARLNDPRPFLYELGHSVAVMARSAVRRARAALAASTTPCSSPSREKYGSRELAG
jgi:predicted ATP-grasp superfamily ATP-dependent carboligase